MSRGPSPSFRLLTARLPETATDIYYRDIIGNISTSAVREGDDAVEMEVCEAAGAAAGPTQAFTPSLAASVSCVCVCLAD